MKQKLITELKKLHPLIADNMAVRYVDKYVAAVMAEISERFLLMSSDELVDAEMNFSVDAVRQASGRYKLNGRIDYIGNPPCK